MDLNYQINLESVDSFSEYQNDDYNIKLKGGIKINNQKSSIEVDIDNNNAKF